MFEYLAERVAEAPFGQDPFRHVYIEEFFSPEHFRAITQQPEIHIPEASSDEDLIGKLRQSGYEVISFPGTTTDVDAYLDWHRDRKPGQPLNGSVTDIQLCEGIGITLRLKSAESAVIGSLMAFLGSDLWLDTVAGKFGIDRQAVWADGGIQKYLDGYEISPHPDIRRKALTYMVNINPAENAAENDYHTHYMRFRPERAYVQEFWKGNPDLDRCWVPWGWCETVTRQTRNNTIVLFQPGDDTVHAVRAHYEHLATQRTQLYGNLWYNQSNTTGKPSWVDFDLRARLAAA